MNLWPRGRHNGQRIVGCRWTVVVDITIWRLVWPSLRYGRCLGLGPLRIWWPPEYAHDN